jgi:hypothetical protein
MVLMGRGGEGTRRLQWRRRRTHDEGSSRVFLACARACAARSCGSSALVRCPGFPDGPHAEARSFRKARAGFFLMPYEAYVEI